METCTRSPERNDAKMFGASRRIREASGISCQMDQLPSFRSVVASFHRPEKEGRQMSRTKTSKKTHHILKRRLQAWVAQGIAWHRSKVNFLFYFTNVSQSFRGSCVHRPTRIGSSIFENIMDDLCERTQAAF